MARYIDADLIPYVESENGVLDDFAYRYDINEIPTADVVPKEEVDKLHEVIFMKEDLMQSIAKERNHYSDEVERLERICHSYALQYGTVTDQQKVIDKAKAEVAREIFEEIEKLKTIGLYGFRFYHKTDIAELKKKYTEEHV